MAYNETKDELKPEKVPIYYDSYRFCCDILLIWIKKGVKLYQFRFSLGVLFLLACAVLYPGIAHSEYVTLSWNNNTEKDLAGYELFYGTESRNYTERIDTGNVTEYTLEGIQQGLIYYFALRAYDLSDYESDFSEEVSYEIEQSNDEGSTKPTLNSAETENSHKLPKILALNQNYPNPFNPTTTIPFDVPVTAGAKQHVILNIYDVRGRLIKKLIDSDLEPGSHGIVWNGRNDRGESVTSGVYLCTLSSRGKTFTKKITVVK